MLTLTRSQGMAMFAALLLAFGGISACGGGGNEEVVTDSANHDDGMVDESTIPAELGGNGFEAVADSLGFVTGGYTDEQIALLTATDAKKGGELRKTITRFVLTFRPFFYGPNANYSENKMFSDFCYEGLVNINSIDLNVTPWLATHWKIHDDSLTYDFRINPDAKFSNGSPVRARDIVATWQLLVEDDLQSPSMKVSYTKFEEPEILSPLMVRIKSKENNWRAILSLGSIAVLSADEIGDLTATEFNDAFNNAPPVGSGPYIVKPENIVNQRSYALTRRPDYWNWDDPYYKYTHNFDRVELEVVQDNPTLEFQKFIKGEQDYFYYTSGTIEDWVNNTEAAYQKGWFKKMRVETSGPSGMWGYALNLRKPPFNDINMRKAFSYLNPRERYIKAALYNEYEAQDSYYDQSPYANPDNPKVRFDPAKAAQFLKAAGWSKRNNDGYLTRDGQILELSLDIVKPVEKFVTPYQEALRAAGIKLNVNYIDGNTNSKNAQERLFTMFWAIQGSLVFPNPESSFKGDLADQNNNNNWWGYSNPVVDSLIEVYDKMYEPATRIKLVQQIDKILMEDYLTVMLYNTKGIKIGYWDKFGFPPHRYSRFCQAGDNLDEAIRFWWYDADRAKRLEEAIAADKPLDPPTQPYTVYDFWRKQYKDPS